MRYKKGTMTHFQPAVNAFHMVVMEAREDSQLFSFLVVRETDLAAFDREMKHITENTQNKTA